MTKNHNLVKKKWQTSEKKTQASDKKSRKNNQLCKVIPKSKYLDQDAGDSNHYHCAEIHQSAAQFDYILHEIGNRIRGCWWTWTPVSRT